MTPDLFDGLDVDYGESRVSLGRARRLVERVHDLEASIDNYYEDCWAVRMEARHLGAHSVARAVGWIAHPDTLGRHGPDVMFARAERVATAWLRRQEVSR